jgi:hypothetical protein
MLPAIDVSLSLNGKPNTLVMYSKIGDMNNSVMTDKELILPLKLSAIKNIADPIDAKSNVFAGMNRYKVAKIAAHHANRVDSAVFLSGFQVTAMANAPNSELTDRNCMYWYRPMAAATAYPNARTSMMAFRLSMAFMERSMVIFCVSKVWDKIL